MYDWLLGHRGDDDAQLELRALFGLPAAVAGPVEVFAVAASSLAAGVRLVEQVRAAIGSGAAAFVDDTAAEGMGAALALALAGADGQVTFSRSTRAAFAEHLCFVRARRRPGWRLPVPCAALAEAPYTRDACRNDAATLRSDGSFVARDDERDALVHAMARGAPAFAVVRAQPGLGASRLVREAARAAGARLHRCVVSRSGPDEAQMAHIITELCMLDGDAARWLVLELPPGKADTLFTPESLAARAPGVGFVVVASPDCEAPWCPPEREVELGPLAPAEARAVVRAMLGASAAEGLVSALARRGGSVPRQLVTLVRTAAASGEIVRDVAGDAVTWRTRKRRLLRKPTRAGKKTVHPPHVAALDAHTRRAWEVCVAAGDGVDRYALRGLLRVVLGAPDATALEAHGLLDAVGTTVDLGRASGSYEGDPNLHGRAAALQTSGSLDVLAEAERSLEGRVPDAASRFARAARASLAVGDLAAAVRLAGVARTLPRPPGDHTVEEALRAVAAQLGGLQVMTPRDARPILTPEALEAAASARAVGGDVTGAARLRALAALLQGDLRPAMQVGREASSVRDLVVASLAHARSGQLTEAARAAVAGLARARREGDAHGEQATLALLASVFGAAGRADDVGRFTAAMRG